MEELLYGLCVLTFVLAIVTVVGHGIWVMLAAIFRAISDQPPSEREKPRRTDHAIGQLSDVRASIRQVERLLQRGEITERLRDGLVRTLREEEARLLRGAPLIAPPSETRPAAEVTPAAAASETAAPAVSAAQDAAESPAATPSAPTAAVPTATESLPAPPAAAEKEEQVVDAIIVASEVPASDDQVTIPAAPPTPAAAASEVSTAQPPAETPVTGLTTAPVVVQLPQRPGEPQPPQRAFSDLLQAFMEERNIRWGELIGGMLIVGSGICLVISLWSTLQRSFPYFPAFVFLAVTAGIFGAGMYTLRKWKLESTSRGLLIISVLLVPLNILAAIAVSKGQPDVDALYLLVAAVGLVAYGAITFTAGRVLVPHAAWALLLAVMGASAGQLVIDHTATPGMSAAQRNFAFALPLGCFLAATISYLAVIRGRRRPAAALLRPGGHMSSLVATESLLLLGTAAFALAMPLALLAVQGFPPSGSWSAKSAVIHGMLADLAPALTTAAAVVMGFGLAIHQRVTRPKWARLRAAGTGLSLFAGVLMVMLLWLAWPDPVRLVIVGVLVFVALAILAIATRMPVLNAPAVISLATAVLLGFHMFTGELPSDGTATSLDVLWVLILGQTSVVLTLVALAACAVAWQLKLLKQDEDAWAVVWGAGSVAAVGLLSALVSGFLWKLEGAAWASLVLGIGAIGMLLLGGRVRRGWVTSIGSALLLIALLQVCMFNQAVVPRGVTLVPQMLIIGLFPFLLHASVCCLFAVSTRSPAVRRLLDASSAADLWRPVVVPLSIWALVTSSLVVLPCLFSWMAPNGWLAVCLFWTAAIWLVVAVMRRWQVMFWLFQAMATAALAVTISSLFVNVQYSARLLGLPHLFSQLAGLAGWSAVWSVVRRDCRRWSWLYELMTPRWPAVDRLCLYVAVAGVLVIAVAGCLPGIDAEMGAYGRVASGWGGNAGVLPRSVDFLQSHYGEASALILALFLFWSLGALSAWSLGAFRRHPQAVAMLVVAGVGSLLVWLAARVGFFVWQFDDIGIRFAATDTMWRLLMLVAVAVAVSFLNRVSTVDLVGLVCLAFTVPLLCAAWFESFGTTASALCWGLSLCGLAIAAAVWARRRLAVFLVRRARLAGRQLRAIRLEPLSALALLVSTLPVLLISLAHLLPLVEGNPIPLPALDTVAGQMRLFWLYAGPLVVLAVTLIGYAVRERSPAFALSGSLLVNAAVTLICGFLVWLPLQGKDTLVVVTFLQWNALAVGIIGLAWLTGRRWVEAAALPSDTRHWQRLFGVPLGIQVTLLLLLAGILTAWAVTVVVLFPSHLPESASLLSGVSGWCTLLLAAVVGGWYFRRRLPNWGVHLAGFITLSAVALIATATHGGNGPHNWLAFHVLSAGWWSVALVSTTLACVGAYLTRRMWFGDATAGADAKSPSLLSACGRWCSRSSQSLAVWATAIGCSVVILAIRGNWIDFEGLDPYKPWWSAALVGGVAVLAAALAVRERSQPYAYASVVLAGLATSFAWVPVADSPLDHVVVQLLQAVTMAVTVASLVWVVIELWWQRRWSSVFDPGPHRVPVHHTSSLAAVFVLSLLLGIYLAVRIIGGLEGLSEATLDTLRLLSGTTGWLAVGGVGLLLVASLWDRTATHAVPALYAWGLVTAATVINRCESSAATTLFGVGLAAGIYVLVTGFLWFGRRQMAVASEYAGLPRDDATGRRVALWLPVGSVVLAGVTAVIAVGGTLCWETLWMRLWITGAAAMAAAGTALIVDARERQSLQQSALLLGAAAAVALGWGVMTPEPLSQWLPKEFWLPRTIRLMVMLAATAFVYGTLLPRCLPRGSDWPIPLYRIAVVAGGAGGVALLVVLGLEVVVFDPLATAPAVQIVIVAAALVGLIVALISLAVQRGADPLGLTQRGRMGYVYAAEVVAALLFLHVYLTMPVLFSNIFLPYWPFIVMGIAFAAVGAGEVLNRSGLNVLSEPITRTGVFLPLLPAIGFWLAFSDPTLTGFTTLLFTIGLLYVLLSIWRGSFVYVVLAALAGNAALWSLLTDFDLFLQKNPQFFMIPPALCVLVAVHFNRDRLTDAQRTAARYLALLTIYVSSTGEMFLQGLDERIWPALVLASLSVLGVLAGMLLRIRAFVYLGASFLLLAILSMIWHAARTVFEHSWPWWAFGIALGILIVTMFGIFEKRRNEMQQMLATFRGWEQ